MPYGVDLGINTDRELAEYMASGLRSERLRAIAGSISPNFVFSSPRVKGYNFEQFCEHVEGLSINIDSKVMNVEQAGDVFTVDVEIETIDIQQSHFSKYLITALVTITDHIVQSIKLEFEANPEEDAYMEKINPIDDEFKPD